LEERGMSEKEKYLGKNWLLDTKEAIQLYHEVAVSFREEVGIVDTHTHHNLRQMLGILGSLIMTSGWH